MDGERIHPILFLAAILDNSNAKKIKVHNDNTLRRSLVICLQKDRVVIQPYNYWTFGTKSKIVDS